MAREFLGRGWKFPVNVDLRGKIATSQYEEDVREAVEIILTTSKGERVMHPDFGCGINNFVFESPNAATRGMMEESVKDSLVLWEPRIEVRDVEVREDASDVGKVLISITYSVRATNNEFNLVYPFHLKE
jgi:phage baseplate assembly protein W